VKTPRKVLVRRDRLRKYQRQLVAIGFLILFFGPLLIANLPNAASETNGIEKPEQKMSSALQTLASSNESRWVDIIIQFKKQAKSTINAMLSSYERSGFLQVKTIYSIIPGCSARVHSSILTELAKNPFIEFLWEDGTCQAADVDFTPLIAGGGEGFVNFTQLINANAFYEADIPGGNKNGSSAVIAILDSGVDITGEVLVGGDLDDFDEIVNTTDPKFLGAVSMLPDDTLYYTDFTGRGTFHTGIACGTGCWNESFVGVAPGAYYLSVKIFDPLGITYWSIIISGIEWAISHGADIIFFGGYLPGLYLDPISLALNAAADQGIFVVVPAGDEGPAYMSLDSPGQTMKAICVGAYNSPSNSVADFSSRGPGFDFRTGPDVIAPGVNLISTRAKIFASDGSIGSLGAFSFDGFNMGGIEVPGFKSGGTTGFSLPNGSLPSANYGTPITENENENYTRASGTGAAAAVVAGAIALLIQVFPTVTPALMKIALRRTARPILGDENAEGAGLIDVYAAYDYLNRYLEIGSIYNFPVSAPLVYPGALLSIDSLNISEDYSLDPDWQYWDSAVMMSTQAMMTAAIIVNGSATNFSQVFLPLNQFGVCYNLEKDPSSGNGGLMGAIDLESLLPNPGDNKSFHWLSEFQVLREMHLASDLSMGREQYRRYAGVLEFGPLMLIIVAETYDYSIDPVKYTNRINAYKLNFHFINTGSKPIRNLTLYSFFKADLFVNEFGALNSTINQIGSMEDIMNFSIDDTVKYNETNQMLYAIDKDNGTAFNDTYGYQPWGAMGFNSTTHNHSGWEIANSIDLLFNITLHHAQLTNGSHYNEGTDDPGWAMRWDITEELTNHSHEVFTGVFGLGFARTNETAFDVLNDQMQRITSNVMQFNVTDIIILDTNTPRIGYLNEQFHANARYINIGNTTIASANILFVANRTLTTGQIDGKFIYTKITNLEPFSIVSINVEWKPIDEGAYSCAWGAADINGLLGNVTETSFLNNYLARNVFIISEEKYNNFADEVMLVTPMRLPVKPFMLKHPGDLAILNITIISVRRQDSLQFGYEGQAKSLFSFNQTNVNITNGYGNLVGMALVPILGASSNMTGTLTFFRPGVPVINRLPVVFLIAENRGRIFFDFIHNNLTISVRNTTIDFGWDERLDSTYGNFYQVREVWANLKDKGASTMTVVPYLTLNLTEFGFDLAAMNSSPAVGALLDKFLGPYSLSSNILTTNTTNHDILQLFDVLVVCDPESPFKPQEIADITAWVEKGGHLLVWAENDTENNVTSLNTLLKQFDLEITGNNSGIVKVSSTNRTNDAIFPRGGDIYLYDPVNFTAKGSAQILCAPGASSGPIAISKLGLGKIVAIGDKDAFNALHLREGNNTGFAQEIMQWFFERKFTWNLTTTPSRPITIDLGQQMYINLEAIGLYKENSTKKVIYLSGFANSSGDMLQVDLMGFKLPVLPLFHSDGYNFVGQFDTLWDNATGMHYVTIYVDAAAFPCEVFLIPINVTYAEPEPKPVLYEFPDAAYPHFLDVVGILGLVILSAFLWYYRNEKWRTRLHVTVLKDELLFEAQARVNEVKAMLKQVNRQLGSDVDELEKIRLLLGNRKRIQKVLKEFKKFGDRIGEYY